MRRIQNNDQKGLTLVEVIIVVFMVVILATLSFQVFDIFNKRQAFEKNAQQIASQIKEARSATLASRDDSAYGIHITATRTVMFKGVTYTESATSNRDLVLNGRVQIGTISLNGGGSDILFDRLTGDTSQYGSITLSLVSSTTITKVISIGEAGIVEF